jgi:hypothetical protein
MSSVHLVIQQRFVENLLCLGTVLSSVDTVIRKTNENPHPHEIYILVHFDSLCLSKRT